MKSYHYLLALILLLALAAPGCKPSPPPNLGSDASNPGIPPGMAAADYWDVEIARRELYRDYLREASALRSFNPPYEMAQDEMDALGWYYLDKIKALHQSRGLDEQFDVLPVGSERQARLEEYGSYLEERPELNRRVAELTTEISALQDELEMQPLSSDGEFRIIPVRVGPAGVSRSGVSPSGVTGGSGGSAPGGAGSQLPPGPPFSGGPANVSPGSDPGANSPFTGGPQGVSPGSANRGGVPPGSGAPVYNPSNAPPGTFQSPNQTPRGTMVSPADVSGPPPNVILQPGAQQNPQPSFEE